MATYTKTFGANQTFGFYSTGITLGQNEVLTGVSWTCSQRPRHKPNKNFRHGYTIQWTIVDSQKTNPYYHIVDDTLAYYVSDESIQRLYWSDYSIDIPNGNYHCRGKTIYIWFHANEWTTTPPGAELVAGDVTWLDSLNITFTTETAKYRVVTSINKYDSGTVTSIDDFYTPETVLNITATPNAGWRFINWTCDYGTFGNSTSASTTYTVAANTNNGANWVRANFERIDYTLTTQVSPASSGTILPSAPLTFDLDNNHLVSFTTVYGNETVTIASDLPMVVKVQKKILNTLSLL